MNRSDLSKEMLGRVAEMLNHAKEGTNCEVTRFSTEKNYGTDSLMCTVVMNDGTIFSISMIEKSKA